MSVFKRKGSLSLIRRVTLRPHSFRCFSQSVRSQNDTNELSVADRLSMKDKTVLVTGGGRGIGFAICKAIAQLGGNIAVIDALAEPVPEFHGLSERYGTKTGYFQADVTRQDSLENAFRQAATSAGEITGCVAAAGIVVDKPFFEHSWDECQRVLQVNTMGCFWTVKLVSEHIAQHGKGGSIVMIASIAAQGTKIPQQNVSIYNMSKAAVKGLAGPLSVELAPHGIRLNTISPGVTLSPMTEGLKTQYPELLRMFESAAPLSRIGVPDDLTPAVVYLLSDAAAFTTGSDLIISGGLHAGTSMEWNS